MSVQSASVAKHKKKKKLYAFYSEILYSILDCNITFNKHFIQSRMNATSPNTDYATNEVETPSARFIEANTPSPSQEETWKTNEASARVVVHRSANLNLRRQKRFHSSSHLES